MEKTILLFCCTFFCLSKLFSADIVIGSLVLNTLENNPIGININFYVDDDNTSQTPKKMSAALKEMGVKYLRYPGGDKADHILFSTPPYHVAKPVPARQGKGADYRREGFLNDAGTDFRYDPLDFDEFMTVCKEAGCEPVIVVPADMYKIVNNMTTGAPLYNYKGDPLIVETNRQFLIDHAAAWVYYANVKKNYNVKYWIIANETEVAYWPKDPKGNNVSCEAKDYEDLIVDFSAAMKAACPNIEIISNGAAWLVESYLKNPEVVKAIDHICCSNYPMMNGYSSYEMWAQKKVNGGVLTTPMDEVLAKINANTAAKTKGIDVWASEFSSMYTGDAGWPAAFDLGHALANMDIIGQMLRNPKFGKMIYWNTHWGGGFSGTGELPIHSDYDGLLPNNDLSPRGFTLSMFGNHLYPKIVQTSTSGTYDGIMTFASRSEDDKYLYVYVINTKGTDENINLKVNNRVIKNVKRVSEIYGDSPDKGGWYNGWTYKKDMPEMNNDIQEISGTLLPLKKYSGSVYHITLE